MVRYIPVEISTGLLMMAVQTIQRSPNIPIPVAILGDFQAGLALVDQTLKEYASRVKPVFFSLLGGTLGNLADGGARFLADLRQIMLIGDSLLVDVSLAGPTWSAATDSRMDKSRFSDPFRRFLTNGITRLDPATLSEVRDQAWFDRRVKCIAGPPVAMGEAEQIRIVDGPTDRLLLRFHRYRWEPLLAWLRAHGFTVRYAKNSLGTSDEPFGMGVLLLGRES